MAVVQYRNCSSRVSGLGTSHVCRRHLALFGAGLFAAQLHGRSAFGDQSFQLDCDHVQGFDLVRHSHALRLWLHWVVHHGRTDRAVPGRSGSRCARARHLLRDRPLPLHHGGRRGHGISRRHAFLVAENLWPHVSGRLGQAGGADYVRWIQSHVLPAVRPGLHGNASPVLAVPARVSGAECAFDSGLDNSRRWLPASYGVFALVHAVR